MITQDKYIFDTKLRVFTMGLKDVLIVNIQIDLVSQLDFKFIYEEAVTELKYTTMEVIKYGAGKR